MLLDSGVISIKRVTSNANAGGLPSEVYEEVFKSCYGEKTVGINRYFTAKAADVQIDMLIEVQRFRALTTDVVDLTSMTEPELNGRYAIIQVQQIDDEDGLPVTDLSLNKIEGVDEP